MRIFTHGRLFPLLAALAFFLPAQPRAHAAEPVTAQALVEKQQVFLGEPFLFQIHVNGSDSPGKPDLGPLTGFTVEDLGGQQNSSESVTIIQGKMTRVVQRAYIFSYRLTAKKTGTLVIPSLALTVAGKKVRTLPVSIRVVPPRENDNFKLRLSLSEKKAYTGQPVILTVTWYVGADVRDFRFTLPVLDDARFTVLDPKDHVDPAKAVQIVLGARQAIAEKGRGTLNGREYLTVRFREILIPRQAGDLAIPPATVAGKSLKGYQRSRRRGVFDDFFNDDFFRFGRQPVYENFVVPSNSPRLRVLELPSTGRPAGFSGLIGRFRLTAEAAPTEVNVGDPITLTLRVTGSGYLDNVELPPLNQQPALARDFKIPSEQAAGVVKGRQKIFKQTIRPAHAGIRQIPVIELSYFNPESGHYETARSQPIPLTVKGTRIVTARDAEGLGPAAPTQSEIETSDNGIAFNYEGPDVLVPQTRGIAAWLDSPFWLAALCLPPLVYFVVLAVVVYRRRRDADPAARRAKQAAKQFAHHIRRLKAENTDAYYAALLEALRRYLGDRIGLRATALTFADVRPMLEQRGISRELIEELRHVFERCEAGRYAGAAFGDEKPSDLSGRLIEIIKKLEASLQ